MCLEQLTDPVAGVLKSADEVNAIGFKAVHARQLSGVQRVTPALLDAMEQYADVAPAHNPIYIQAMRTLAARFPSLPLVAAFETGFHATIPDGQRHYAIPRAGPSWASSGTVFMARVTVTYPGACRRSSAARI